MNKHRLRQLWVAGLLIAGCNAYDSSLINGTINSQAISGGGSGVAGIPAHADEDGGDGTLGQGGTPAEPSAGGPTSGAGPIGSVAGKAGQPSAGRGGGGSSGVTGSGSGGSSAGGTLGTAGKGGSSGTNGGGNATSGGGSASGGASGTAGSGGATPSGCALLSIPLQAATDFAHFLITFDADTDLSSATLNARVYTPNATGGLVYLYVQQSSYEYYAQSARTLAGLGGWATISWDLSNATPSGFDKTKVRRIGVGVDGRGSTAWVNPTLVYVDSFTVTSPSLGFQLDSSSTVNTTPTTYHAGDNAMWLNSAPSDTTATGSKISWSATCN
jgi:hypothetical protein